MITCIIIDDEKSGRETLSILIQKHFANKLHVISLASSLKEGVELIEKFNPQLIFLDLEMPNENGLSIVNKFTKINFEIIVTTAHRKYGIDAIKVGVIDYLLKPINIDELAIALNKIELKIVEKQEDLLLKKLLNNITHQNTQSHKVPLYISTSKTIFVEPHTIVRCEAEGNYTKVWFTHGDFVLITKIIKEVEELLSPYNFFRVHKSHLINMEHIKAYLKLDDNIAMIDNSIVPLSRSIKTDFLKKMNL